MGRKKIEIQAIEDERVRRVCFKKRRIGLFKKAIQLSKLTGCKISMKIWNEEDNSLMEYHSKSANDIADVKSTSQEVKEFTRFYNRNYEIVELLEENLTKHGHLNIQNYVINGTVTDVSKELEGFNLQSVFSLAKIRDDSSEKKLFVDTNLDKAKSDLDEYESSTKR